MSPHAAQGRPDQLQQLQQQVQALTAAVIHLTAQHGARITREALCERLGVHRNTILKYLQTDTRFPRPLPDGKWLLADVMRWEMDRNHH